MLLLIEKNMSETVAAAPQQEEKQTETKNWKKTAGQGNKRRGPPCEYKYWDGKQCPKNGLYDVEGRNYCLNHARQFQRRQAKLKEGPKKKMLPQEPVKKPLEEEPKDKVEPPQEKQPVFEKEELPESEEDELTPVKGKMPVEQLVVDTPKVQKIANVEKKKRSPPVEKPHQESKRPQKMRRVEFEDTDSDKENSPPQRGRKIKQKRMDLSSTYTFPTGEKRLKNLFKSATQLNTGGQMRKPNGSVFGLFK